jgi:hypothetical protein
VRIGDATAMLFLDGIFSFVLSFTMLHHLPSSALQVISATRPLCCAHFFKVHLSYARSQLN